MTATSGTRGERNANPGNLQFMPHSPWRGQVGLETVRPGMSYKPRFGRYDTDHNGIRAIAKQLLAYQQRDGLRSIWAMLNRWCPLGDGSNDPDSYSAGACNYCGVGVNDDYPLVVGDNLAKLVFSIIRRENGRVLYDAELIASACRDALGLPIAAITPP